MKNNRKTRHQRPRIFRRASLQETTRAGAASSSFSRWAISRSHSASASASTTVSRLSNNEPAIAARASGRSFNAASNNFDASDPMSDERILAEIEKAGKPDRHDNTMDEAASTFPIH